MKAVGALVAALLLMLLLAAPPAAAQPVSPPAGKAIYGLIETRQYELAEKTLQAELRNRPRWETGHLLLAQVYNQTRRFDLARASALNAFHIRESLDALMLVASAAMELGNLNESIEWLEKAAGRWPDHAEIYRILGMDYALGGMLRESEMALRRAVELQPANWEYHYLEGRVLYDLNRHRESEKELRQATELDPSSVKAWTGLGQVQERFLDFAGARRSYARALDHCPDSGRDCAWPLLQLGVLESREGASRTAEAYLRRAIQARPDWAKPHFYVAKLRLAEDDLAGARAGFEESVRLDPEKPEYHYQLANVCRQLGLEERATLHFARFREISALQRKSKQPVLLAQP